MLLNAQEIDIQTYTNGQDADTPPGPALTAGATVNWTYLVSNTGSRPLANIVVTDDQGVTVTCPATTLDAGLSFVCTASGVATLGQYANIGSVTATQPDTTVVNASDPSHYFGEPEPSVTIETRTNGADADTPTGPSVPVGSTVNWTYEITNIGSQDLGDIIVTDSGGAVVTCPGTTLAIGASMTCTASGTATVGQYANTGSVTATLAVSEDGVAASDPSHYYGQTLEIIKRTNGIESHSAPGPTLIIGSTVNWTYQVTNPGPATVTGLTVTDDQGVTVTCGVTTLDAFDTVTCTGSGAAVAGQYANVGTAQATLPLGGIISVSDTNYYFGNPITILKSTNGFDANLAPGPAVLVGSTVNWTYEVTNYAGETLTAVAVTDDQGVTVTCPSTTLAAGETMTCTASGVAIAGQYANVGTVDATSTTYGALSASDASHYFGQTSILDFGDAPDPTYQTLLASNGARHTLGGGVYLGACVDVEVEGLQSATAGGDDADAGTAFGTCATAGDDEDGVTFTSVIAAGLIADVDVVAAAPCTLSAWIDFNGDGDWGEASDDLFPGGTALVAGTNPLTFNVPANAVLGTSVARFRCTTDGAVGFTGAASDGEVEDYEVEIVAAEPSMSATKTDAVQIDVDNDTVADPGDTVRYTIVITNGGLGSADSVFFNDTPDANTGLVVGSVTTSLGSVTTGNTAGDTSVAVNVGTIPGNGGNVTITFDVTIDNPISGAVTTVSNQGSTSGANFTTFPTDDPAVGGTTDPTVTPLILTPIVAATKVDAIFTDGGTTGIADPGDVIRYTITVTNSGNGDATALVFNDTPDANTTLLNGSVTTDTGSVALGNTAGDTSVTVNIGTLAAGASAVIVFDVTVNGLPSTVTQIVNTGTVTGSNISPTSTDDPSRPGASDGTVTAAAAAAAQIPTADVWALLALMTLLGIVAMRRL